MKKTVLTTFLLLGAFLSLSAQADEETPSKEELYKQQLRANLALDYSMPDFSTTKPNPNIIGTRLAKMLDVLLNSQQDIIYKRLLSFIQAEQQENLKYVVIDHYKLKKIEKKGDEITILFQTFLMPNSTGVKNSQMTLRLLEGVSNSQYTNDLFAHISRYIKE